MKEDWGRLGDYVRAGRARRGFANRRAFAAHLSDIGHPVTERTLGSLERGERVSMDTVVAVEIGLSWAPGSGRAILYGGGPTTMASEPSDARVVQQPPEIPSYVIREDTEDWEWEIWEKLTLLDPSDKALMIEFVKGVHRRARATESSDQESRSRRHSA